MTILEAIKEDIDSKWGISESSFRRRLSKRGLNPDDELTSSAEKQIELAVADTLMILVNSPDISEGGYKISSTDKNVLKETASGIYSKWGIADPSKPTAGFISPW